MQNIFEALREDHGTQRYILSRLFETQDLRIKHSLFIQLKDQLRAHAIYEDKVLYKPMLENFTTQDKARICQAEHTEINELIDKLDKSPMNSTQWMEIAKQLKFKVLNHLDEEEKHIFKLASDLMKQSQQYDQLSDYDEGTHISY